MAREVRQVVDAVGAVDCKGQVDGHVSNHHGASLASDAANQGQADNGQSDQSQEEHEPAQTSKVMLVKDTTNCERPIHAIRHAFKTELKCPHLHYVAIDTHQPCIKVSGTRARFCA